MPNEHPVESESNRHASGPSGRAAAAHTDRVGAKPETPGQPLDFISTMEAQITALKQARADQDRQAAEILQRETTAARRHEELEERETTLGARESAIRQSEESVKAARQEVEAKEREHASSAESLRKAQADLEREREKLAAAGQTLAEMQQGLEGRESALAEQTEETTKLRAQLEDGVKQLKARVEETDRELKRKQAEVDESTRALDAETAHAAERAGGLAKDREQFETEKSKFAAKCAERERALATLKQEIEQSRQAAAAERGGSTKTAVDQAVAAAKAEIAKHTEAIGALESQREQAGTQLAAAQRRITELESKLATAGAERVDGDNQVVTELEREIEKRDRALQALKDRLEQTKAELERMQDEATDPARNAEQEQFNSAGAGLRRIRLRRYKTLLREQSSKIMQARSALAKRHEQYESLLQKRGELAAAKLSLEKIGAKIEKASARNKVAVAMVSIVATIALIGALSWAVAERIVTSTFLLQATVQAQGDGQTLTREQLEGWQQSIVQLAHDPGLMEVVAERMKKRGILDLSSASAAGAKLKADLDVAGTQSGEVTLSLRGEGLERTKHVLDTYLASLIAVANESRERRLDQATTSVVPKTGPDPGPIEQPHLLYAGAIWAGTTGFALIAGFGAWLRLSHSKRRFEETDPSLRSLDESQWPEPPAN